MALSLPLTSFFFLFFFLSLLLSFPSVSDAEVETHLHFYLHDIVSGTDPSSVRVTTAPGASTTGFGSIVMMDDPLTEQPDPNSRLIGRAQGIYALASQEVAGQLMAMNFVFVDGQYRNSTIAVLGRNDVSSEATEMPVVGGSGYFRLARGYAIARTNQLDRMSGNAIVEYDVHVLHL